MKRRVAWWIDARPWWLWWLQPAACFILGHEPIELESGRTCAYCLKGL
jgi:hypothetical protein